jgi:xanthine dehydrogenase accessory factor
MRELRALVAAARHLRASGEPFLVSTVVNLKGSAYRGLGARMISTAERWVAGSVSGGCLERDVLRKGFWQTSECPAVLIEHDDASDETSGTGCQGRLELLIERAPSLTGPSAEPRAACDPLALAARCLHGETVAAVATVYRSKHPSVKLGDRLAAIESEQVCTFEEPSLERELALALLAVREQGRAGERAQRFVSADGRVEALLERLAPPPHLFVFGAAHDSAAVVSLAQTLGFSATVCAEHALDHVARERFQGEERLLIGPLREAVAALDRCAEPVAMVMAHHYERDRAAIAALASSKAQYIGVLGPAQRTERMLADLVAANALSAVEVEALRFTRLHAPAGLDLGSRTPAEVALSILAEIQSELGGTTAQGLRHKAQAIHACSRERWQS